MIDITHTSNHYLIFIFTIFAGLVGGVIALSYEYFKKEINNKILDIVIDFLMIITLTIFFIATNLFIDYGNKRAYCIIAYIIGISLSYTALKNAYRKIKSKYNESIENKKMQKKAIDKKIIYSF